MLKTYLLTKLDYKRFVITPSRKKTFLCSFWQIICEIGQTLGILFFWKVWNAKLDPTSMSCSCILLSDKDKIFEGKWYGSIMWLVNEQCNSRKTIQRLFSGNYKVSTFTRYAVNRPALTSGDVILKAKQWSAMHTQPRLHTHM